MILKMMHKVLLIIKRQKRIKADEHMKMRKKNHEVLESQHTKRKVIISYLEYMITYEIKKCVFMLF